MRIPFLDKFPARAIVFQKRGNGHTAFIDRARFMSKKGTNYYELKKYKAKFRPSSFDDFVPMTNGKPLILLYEYQRDMIVPINTSGLTIVYERDGSGNIVYEWSKCSCDSGHHFTEPIKGKCPHCGSEKFTELKENEVKAIPKIKEVLNLHALDEDMKFWGQMRRWEAETRHSPDSWLSRNKEFVMMALVFVFFIMLSYIFMQNVSETGMSVTNAINNLVQIQGVPG